MIYSSIPSSSEATPLISSPMAALVYLAFKFRLRTTSATKRALSGRPWHDGSPGDVGRKSPSPRLWPLSRHIRTHVYVESEKRGQIVQGRLTLNRTLLSHLKIRRFEGCVKPVTKNYNFNALPLFKRYLSIFDNCSVISVCWYFHRVLLVKLLFINCH